MELNGIKLATLTVPTDALATPMAVSFEEAAGALAALPRLFFEPDGSLVWTSPAGEPAWQVDGNLYDRDGRLAFVDLKGTCPREALDRLLDALGRRQAPLMFQLVRQAIFLDEAEFRRHAENAAQRQRDAL